MYDSGGLSLKPSDPIHAAMKLDMSGAGAVMGAMTALRDLECPTAVTGFLMCTDNMPSGSATRLGDVLTFRGGTTVEVKNIDAEGRLVLADGMVLATEERPAPDAIVTIATLTGAAMRTFGDEMAAVLGTDQPLVEQLLERGQHHRRAAVAAAPDQALPQVARTPRSPTCATWAGRTPARSRPRCSWPSSPARRLSPTWTSAAR